MNVSSLSGTGKQLAEHDKRIALVERDITYIRDGIDKLLKQTKNGRR